MTRGAVPPKIKEGKRLSVDSDGHVVLPKFSWKERVNIFFEVEIHWGGIFLSLLIKRIADGKEESLRLFLLEIADGVPVRHETLGLALPPERLPGFEKERISFRDLFSETDGSHRMVVARLEKRLRELFVRRGKFRCKINKDGMAIRLFMMDGSSPYELSTFCSLKELKKFLLEGASP